MYSEIYNTKEEWLEARSFIAGGSDIGALVYYYEKQAITGELKMKISDVDKPFNDLYQVWNSKKGGASLPFPEELKQIGDFVELEVAPQVIKTQFGDDFEMNGKTYRIDYNPDINPWAGATLDGWFTKPLANAIYDFDGRPIRPEDGPGVIECKAMNFFDFNRKNVLTEGMPLAYLLQLQYQMMVTNMNWGVFIVGVYRVPGKDEEINTQNSDCFYGQYGEKVCEIHCEQFVYRKIDNLCKIIKYALEKFKHDWDNNIEPEVFNHKKANELIREKLNANELVIDGEGEIDDIELGAWLKQLQDVKELLNEYDGYVKEKNELTEKIKAKALLTNKEVVYCNDFKITNKIKQRKPLPALQYIETKIERVG